MAYQTNINEFAIYKIENTIEENIAGRSIVSCIDGKRLGMRKKDRVGDKTRRNNILQKIYADLMAAYGPQGWWPLLDYAGTNPTKTGSITGYHPGVYGTPSSREQVFEVAIGAILTQSVGWVSVEKALRNLKELGALHPKRLLQMDEGRIKEAIRPVGYYNEKTRKIRIFTQFFVSLTKIPSRDELLDIWGIGPETADSIFLYGYHVPTFVIDAYTRRILVNLGIVEGKEDYAIVKALFENNLKKDVIVFQEYHALLVEHAKRYYARGMDVKKCPLYKKFVKGKARARA